MQQGRAVARNMLRGLRGEARESFHYRDKGMLATIGRGRAVGRIGRLHLKGAIAWLAWLFVHILFLIGFRNRLLVVLEWAWAYATWGRGARLIVDTAEQWQLVAQDVRVPRRGVSGCRRRPPRIDGGKQLRERLGEESHALREQPVGDATP